MPTSILSRQHLASIACGTVFLMALAAPAAAQQCPDWRQNGAGINTDAETLWSPRSWQVTAGGTLNLSNCAAVPGIGFVTAPPDFTVTYDARNLGHALDFRVEAQCDTVMLINDAGAHWHFSDDEDGTINPRVRLGDAQSGVYDVWVGTFGQRNCPATLVLETFPAAVDMGNCPNWSLDGVELQLAAGLRLERPVVAGGPINLSMDDCGTGGHGHVAQAPDFSLYYEAGNGNQPLQFDVQAECDTLLLVSDPATGWWFNDDHIGLDPQIVIHAPQSGRYDIWVGTYGEALCSATMNIAAVSARATPMPTK